MSQSEVMFVSRGRSIILDGTSHGPGSVVKLDEDEAARLKEKGFVQPEPPRLDPTATPPNPGAIGRVA